MLQYPSCVSRYHHSITSKPCIALFVVIRRHNVLHRLRCNPIWRLRESHNRYISRQTSWKFLTCVLTGNHTMQSYAHLSLKPAYTQTARERERETDRDREKTVCDWLGVYGTSFSFCSHETSTQLLGRVIRCFRVKVRKETDTNKIHVNIHHKSNSPQLEKSLSQYNIRHITISNGNEKEITICST